MNDIFGYIFVAVGLLITVSPLLVIAGMYINALIYDITQWFRKR